MRQRKTSENSAEEQRNKRSVPLLDYLKRLGKIPLYSNETLFTFPLYMTANWLLVHNISKV